MTLPRNETPILDTIAIRKLTESPPTPFRDDYVGLFADADGALFVIFRDGTVEEIGGATPEVSSITEKVAGEGIELDGQLYSGAGSATGEAAISLGTTVDEGTKIKVIEEVVDLTAAGAKFVALTTPIPVNAVIISAQANIETAVVAGGTTVKVALGLNGGDVDLYGKTLTLAKNQKINTIPDWASLAAPEQIDVCGVVTDGSALGDSNFTAGTVRVRIAYIEAVALKNAP